VLPVKNDRLKMVQHMNQVIVSGGWDQTGAAVFYTDMYTLACVTQGCTWEVMTTELSVARHNHVAVIVPDNFVNCP